MLDSVCFVLVDMENQSHACNFTKSGCSKAKFSGSALLAILKPSLQKNTAYCAVWQRTTTAPKYQTISLERSTYVVYKVII